MSFSLVVICTILIKKDYLLRFVNICIECGINDPWDTIPLPNVCIRIILLEILSIAFSVEF